MGRSAVGPGVREGRGERRGDRGEENGSNRAGGQVWQVQAYIIAGQIPGVRMLCVLGCKYRGVYSNTVFCGGRREGKEVSLLGMGSIACHQQC